MARPRWVTDEEARYYQIGEAWTLSGKVVSPTTGFPLVPTAATITIVNSGGGALSTPVTAAAMTIASNRLSYTLAAGNVTAPQRGMQARITVTVGSEVHEIRQLFDAVRIAPVMIADLSDVADHVPGIADYATQEDPNNQEVLRAAWTDVLEWLRGLQRYPDLVLDQTSLRKGHVLRTCELLYRRSSRRAGDEAHHQSMMFREEWMAWQKSAALWLDADRSGTLDEGESPRSIAVVQIGRREA